MNYSKLIGNIMLGIALSVAFVGLVIFVGMAGW